MLIYPCKFGGKLKHHLDSTYCFFKAISAQCFIYATGIKCVHLWARQKWVLNSTVCTDTCLMVELWLGSGISFQCCTFSETVPSSSCYAIGQYLVGQERDIPGQGVRSDSIIRCRSCRSKGGNSHKETELQVCPGAAYPLVMKH